MTEAFPTELSLVPIAAAPRRCERVLDERCGAPGWFDSSWELRRGLEVKEGWLGEEGLNGWLESFLSAQRACGRTASPSASTAIA